MKQNKAFTLIELLVVIAIIGILSTVVLVNLSGTRQRARDARRKSDLANIRLAIEMFYDAQTSPAYPEEGALHTVPNALLGEFMSGGEVPTDPKGSTAYCYIKDADLVTYNVCAKLESVTTDPVFCMPDESFAGCDGM